MAKIVIGNPVNTPVIKNKFMLTLNFTHGDSDSYSSENYKYDLKDKEKLETILTTIDNIINDVEDDRELICSLIREHDGIYLSEEDKENEESLSDILDNLWEHDCIYIGCRTDLDYEVVFYDENGIKKDVSVV